MSFLEPVESVKLQNIITRYPGIESEGSRMTLLKICGIYELVAHLDLSGGSAIFIPNLIAGLLELHLATANGSPALVTLLQYVQLTTTSRLSTEEMQFLNDVMERCREWYDAHNPAKKAMRQAFAATSRQALTSSTPASAPTAPLKLDFKREIVIKYDLDPVMNVFTRPLEPGRASGFVIASDLYFLQNYVIQRMQHVLEDEIAGEHCPIELHLNLHDLQNFPVQMLLEEKIRSHVKSKSACELVTKYPKQHINLVIWNHDLPMSVLQEAVLPFWQEFVPRAERYLSRKNLCFVLILAHLLPEAQDVACEPLTSLHLPAFDVQNHLRPWLSRKLYMLGIPDRTKNAYLQQLKDVYTNPVQILMHLERIASTLQGEYDKGRYEDRPYHTRGRLVRR